MAEIIQKPDVSVGATMKFSEAELRALDALVGYGIDPFLKAFYKYMGEAYMRPHEAGMRQLFESISMTVPSILRRADDARAVFSGAKVAARPEKAKEANQEKAS